MKSHMAGLWESVYMGRTENWLGTNLLCGKSPSLSLRFASVSLSTSCPKAKCVADRTGDFGRLRARPVLITWEKSPSCLAQSSGFELIHIPSMQGQAETRQGQWGFGA